MKTHGRLLPVRDNSAETTPRTIASTPNVSNTMMTAALNPRPIVHAPAATYSPCYRDSTSLVKPRVSNLVRRLAVLNSVVTFLPPYLRNRWSVRVRVADNRSATMRTLTTCRIACVRPARRRGYRAGLAHMQPSDQGTGAIWSSCWTCSNLADTHSHRAG